jgi:predicted ATP-binding protein involved in virulence
MLIQPMKITNLSLKNYRGAESLDLELDPNLNVLIGVNGAGKSTVLDAIAIMLSWMVNRIKSVGASGRPITEADITNGYSATAIEITCIDCNQVISWQLAKVRQGHSLPEFYSDLSKLNIYTKQIQSNITENPENLNLPILIYYPVNRAVLDIPLKIRKKHSFTLIDAYDESLISGASFRVFFEWFREKEDLENEAEKHRRDWPKTVRSALRAYKDYGKFIKRSYLLEPDEEELEAGEKWKANTVQLLRQFTTIEESNSLETLKMSKESIDYILDVIIKVESNLMPEIENYESQSENAQDAQLVVVRKSLEKILPNFTGFSIRRSPLRMEVKKNGKKLIINQLSDGEKCLIALVGDLARRLAIANPTRENPLEGEGIVLIDEIDLHLHPKWQRNVIPKLTEVFPNCQFIISTHSPHVINQVQPDNIFLLDQTPAGIVATHPSKSYGNNADRILEDLMGLETTRPDNVFQDLRDIYELISQDDLSEATNKIAILKDKIGSDPELVKAEVLIRRKEIIGK